MTDKVHGFTETGFEALTGNMDFFTVRTTVNILPNGQVETGADGDVTGDATSQNWLDLLVETVSLRAQPVIASPVSISIESVSSISDLPATEQEGSTGNDNVYVFKFAIEHTEAWSSDLLSEALNSLASVFVWTSPTTNNNVAITRNLTL